MRRVWLLYFFIQEGFEFRSGFALTDEVYAIAARFERLHDDIDATSEKVLAVAETLIAQIEAPVFECHLRNALNAVGITSFSNSATEFLQSLNSAIALEATP